MGPTLVALFTDNLFGRDDALGQSMALTIAIAAPISALLLWQARQPYREAIARIDF